MDDLATRLADLPPEKRRLLVQALIAQGDGLDAFPLSFAQERLWFLDQWAPGAPIYTLPAALRMAGPLRLAALARSLQAIVARHESLRTIFVAVDGRPLQLILPPAPGALPLLDLRALAAPARDALAERLLHDAARQPFALDRGPLLRPALLRLGDQRHLLLLSMHHIITDGWSLGVFVRELGSCYAAACRGSAPDLPPLPIQYADYAAWQRQWWDAGRCAPLLDYWRRALDGAPPLLDLPTDRPRPPIQTFSGARLLRDLPAPLAAALRGYCQARGGTLFMGMLAAFALLLARQSGQTDLLIGAPIAGRNRPELEGLIGCFLNTLALRIDLAGCASFDDLFARAQAACLGAYAHQDIPFEKLLDEIQPQRELSHTPLFQVFFNMLNYPAEPIALPDLTIEPIAPPEVAAKFDLTLYVTEERDQIQLELVYNTDLFEAARMEELLAQYQFVLEQALRRPGGALAQISLATPGARAVLPDPAERMDDGWAGAVHSALARNAREYPARPALIDAHEVWSYAELDRRSSQLAHYLIARGVRPGDIVAIYAHRSAALVWALFGVLKAGAAFLILDPAYPTARLIDYLQIARPRAWVEIAAAGPCPADLEQCAGALAADRHLALPPCGEAEARAFLADYSYADPALPVGPDDRACVTFTSGSTGRPKGIVGRHGPLSHFLPWQSLTFGLGAADRFSMLSGLSHDPLQRDVFTPIWLGAALCIPHAPDITTPGRLAEWMHQQAITIAHLTPALAQILTKTTRATPPNALTSLRYAFIVGDVLTRNDIARIRAIAPTVACVNFYGSTETQRAVGYYVVPSDDAPGDAADSQRAKEILPLGRGMQDVQLLVLGGGRRLAGVGEIGEIYVRSPHLALGYLGRPDLTAARFIPNPFTTGSGIWGLGSRVSALGADPEPQTLTPEPRLYRTGDLGRYRPDGNVEFCGRADGQVKVRGFRVEPGEIESLLRMHPAVRDAVALVRDARLVAYVVASNEARVTRNEQPGGKSDSSRVTRHASLAAELRNWLRERLPAYMIPAAFVDLAALPVTPNGKIDRSALPAPDRSQREHAREHVAPQTELERLIASVWQSVLEVESVGAHDNFFDLGGNSIQMVHVCSALQEALRRDLSIVELFQYPTVGALSRYLGREPAAPSDSPEIQDRVEKQRQALGRQRRLRPVIE